MNNNSKENIANNIKNLRLKKKMTREALSLALDFENSYISKLERKYINITIERLDKIANYFNIETSKLLR